MKKLFILKTLVDIVWIISILIGFALLAVFIAGLFSTGSFSESVEVIGKNISTKVIPLFAVVYTLYLIIIHKFRSIVKNFFRNKIFDNLVINNLKHIGYLTIVSTIGYDLAIFLNHLTEGLFVLQITEQLAISLILGLFFIVLSEIFTISKAQKEENELTI